MRPADGAVRLCGEGVRQVKLIGFRVTEKTAHTGEKKDTKQKGTAPRRRRRRKRRGSPLRIVIGVLCILALVLLVQHLLSRQSDAGLRYVGDIAVHEDFLPEGAAARPGEKRKILYVVIHETDNINAGANAQGHNKFIHSNGVGNKLSWHYTVDEHEIWHHLPDDETAFHAGDNMDDKGGNKNGIGIEMCVNADGDYEQTLKNTQKLAATLLYEYDLPIDALKKHEDFSGKCCPSRLIGDGRWAAFEQGVQAEREHLEQQEQTK